MATTVTRLLVAQQATWRSINNYVTQNKKFVKESGAYKYYTTPMSRMVIYPFSNTIYEGMTVPVTGRNSYNYWTDTISLASITTYNWSSLQPFIVSNSTIQDNTTYDIKFKESNGFFEFVESISDNTTQACSLLAHNVVTGIEAEYPSYPVKVGDEITITKIYTSNVTYTTANKDYANNFNVADNLNVRARFLARVNFIPSYAGNVFTTLMFNFNNSSRTWSMSTSPVTYINTFNQGGSTFNSVCYGYGSFTL